MREYHLLHVENSSGGHTYCLDAATISIGRDAANSIRVNDPLVSRQHAVLLRMPSDTAQYSYQLIDGSVDGQLSRNGVQIN